ncbi:MAG: uracil-DNA glycosylase [Cocleimonas sp.]|jgi:uracil-DNA glycosylase
MNENIALDPSWLAHLNDEFEKSYMIELKQFLLSEKQQGKTILPPPSQWFNALNSMSFEQLKVVILGQDPYPTAGHAHGLSFSVLPEVKPLPKSLLNINKELFEDLGIDNSHTGNLQSWADQGVLLLNSVLTVEQGNANAHQGKGWEHFTDEIIQTINDDSENIVFILWGAYAQKKGALIDQSKHHLITSAHPSPLSAYRGFWGSKPFSKTNDYLKLKNKTPIQWAL